LENKRDAADLSTSTSEIDHQQRNVMELVKQSCVGCKKNFGRECNSKCVANNLCGKCTGLEQDEEDRDYEEGQSDNTRATCSLKTQLTTSDPGKSSSDLGTKEKSPHEEEREIKDKDMNREIMKTKDEVVEFRCLVCGHTSKHRGDLKKHILQRHAPRYYFHCPRCFRTFKRVYTYRDHHYHHSVCESRQNRLGIDELKKLKRKMKSQECDNEELVQKFSLKYPSVPVPLVTKGKCTDRNVKQKVRETLENMEKVKVKKVVKVLEAGKCRLCGATFKQACELEDHMVKHVNGSSTRFTCLVCRKTFVCSKNIKRHMRSIHEGEKPWECGGCGRRFNRKYGLTSHQQNRKCGVV